MKFTPFIKWPGGKTKELEVIHKNLPSNSNNYYEPFLGGGSVFLSLNYKKNFVNDFSEELMTLYDLIKVGNKSFFNLLDEINKTWKLLDDIVASNKDYLEKLYKSYKIDSKSLSKLKLKDAYKNKIYTFVIKHSKEFNGLLEDCFNHDIDNFLHQINKSLLNKISRMHKIETERGPLSEKDIISNILTAFKAAYYTHFRYVYNYREHFGLSIEFSSALYYFIREHCYSSMFRYNKQGHFNVPYGGISYNSKNFEKKINYIKSIELQNKLSTAKYYRVDFEEFFNKTKPGKGDFIFLDPPYDTDFSTYAKNDFDKKDQIRLANFLKNTDADFMMIIKNTDFIYRLYNVEGIFIKSFDKKYLVSFKNRNVRDVIHVVITNYAI